MNTKIYSCLLALSTFTSAVSIGIAPVSAQSGNGSENGFNNPVVQPAVTAIAVQSVATVNAAFSTIISANAQAFSSVTTPAALVPPGASPLVANTAQTLANTVAGLGVGNITAPQLATAVNAYNAHATALVNSVGGAEALAFLSSAGGVKSADGTSAPNLRSQLLKLTAAFAN